MSVHDFDSLVLHAGHKVVVATYGPGSDTANAMNAAIECEVCNEVLLDYDAPLDNR